MTPETRTDTAETSAVKNETAHAADGRSIGSQAEGRAVNVSSLMTALVLLAGFAELAYIIVNISAMPVYIRDNGLPTAWVGAVASAFLLAEGLLKSPFGVLGDRVGRKALILAGPLVSTFTALLTPWVHHPVGLIGLRLIDGIGAAALWPSAFSLIGDHVPEQKRATAMSMFNVAYLLGIALGPAIGGVINDATHHLLLNSFHLSQGAARAASKDASFYVAALMFAVTALTAWRFVPNLRVVHHDPADIGPGIEGGFSFTDFKRMLGRMPWTLLMAFVTFTAVGLVMAYAKLFAMQTFGLSESQFGLMLFVPAVGIATVSVPLGLMVDRVGKGRAVRWGIGLCAFSFWVLIAYPVKWNLMVMGTLLGIGFVVAFPAWMAMVSMSCSSQERGAVVGAVGTAQGLGAIVGVVASSFLYQFGPVSLGPITIPAHGLPFLGCAIMLLLSFVIAAATIRDAPACPTPLPE